MKKITLVAALSDNHCIGYNNQIPWYIAEDFAFFKAYTLHKPVIMGRKTWESLPRKPLIERQNIVITRQNNYIASGASIAGSLEEALKLSHNAPEIIIMGGAAIYAEALKVATDLRLTHVHKNIAGDTFFPEITPNWHCIEEETHVSKNGLRFTFKHYLHAPKQHSK